VGLACRKVATQYDLNFLLLLLTDRISNFIFYVIVPSKTIPVDELKCLLPLLYVSLEDRSASVRGASEKAVLGFMMHLGYASMYGACEKLKVFYFSTIFRIKIIIKLKIF